MIIPYYDGFNSIGSLTAQAYTEQCELGWNVLFRGFWSSKWRLAQEEQFKANSIRERQDTGERWAGKVQLWFIKLFESLWGVRNEGQHGLDDETKRLVRATKCARAIRRLYAQGAALPHYERHPFRGSINELLTKHVSDQELMWISQTERYLPKVWRRARKRGTAQPAMTDHFARQS